MEEGGNSQPEFGNQKPEDFSKSEVGGQNSEEEKSEVGGQKSEEQNNATPNNYKQDIAESEIEPLQTADLNPQTEQMEVHHHPEVEKKTLKEYLLEGLMIFLAVMMGFFAESLREHISENSRAKEYATTLYGDLKTDTTVLNRYLKRLNYVNTNIDTLTKLLSASDPKDVPSGKLYFYGLFGGIPLQFAPHDATLLEMKSSGSLRYFTKRTVNRLIAEYDQRLQSFKSLNDRDQPLYTEVRKLRALLFNFKYNEAANVIVQRNYRKFDQAPIDSFIKTNPPLLSTDKSVFNQYIEMVRSRFLRFNAASADTLRQHEIDLIRVLKKEYDLEDE